MSTDVLRDAFASRLGPAGKMQLQTQMQTQCLPRIQQKAATLAAGRDMAMLRGQQGGPA
jgi:hypothetical protein